MKVSCKKNDMDVKIGGRPATWRDMLPSPIYQDPAFGDVGETLQWLANSLVGQTQVDIVIQIMRTNQRDQEV